MLCIKLLFLLNLEVMSRSLGNVVKLHDNDCVHDFTTLSECIDQAGTTSMTSEVLDLYNFGGR